MTIPETVADVQSAETHVQSAETQDITISPFYQSAVNEITQPDAFAAHSHYLTRRWKRELGPTGYAILTSLRSRCYLNRKTGERRESARVLMADIAEECGISERTVRRELDTNKALQRFVQAQREYDPEGNRGGFRNGAKSFRVSMDDPLHPSDEPQLIAIVRRKAEDAEKQQETPLERARRLSASGQSDRTQAQACDNLTARHDNLSNGPDNLTERNGQIDRALKSPDSSVQEINLMTAPPPHRTESRQRPSREPEVFASLFEDREEPLAIPLRASWADLLRLASVYGHGPVLEALEAKHRRSRELRESQEVLTRQQATIEALQREWQAGTPGPAKPGAASAS